MNIITSHFDILCSSIIVGSVSFELHNNITSFLQPNIQNPGLKTAPYSNLETGHNQYCLLLKLLRKKLFSAVRLNIHFCSVLKPGLL